MNRQVFFCGSFPKFGEQPYGGGEVGNSRTVRMLESGGYEVTVIRKFKSESDSSRFQKLVSYPIRLVAGWLVLFFKLLFGSRKALVHVSGFSGKTIFNEYVTMHLVRFLGYKVLYELRGGGAIMFWENGTARYKRMFKSILEKACCVFVQGKEAIPLINSICNVQCYHYPNCVEDGFVPDVLPPKPKERVNLLFYGRIEKNKHVDMIVEIAALVQKAIPDVYLTIIGNGQKGYVDMIKDKMNDLLLPGSFSYSPGCSHKDLPPVLVDKHFYLFPSTQPREGQSNSVTECMGFGILPIASPQGFNRSTIGEDYLIIDNLLAEDYASRIIEIINTGRFESLSMQMQNRFKENYTQKIVFEKTLKEYKRIIQ